MKRTLALILCLTLLALGAAAESGAPLAVDTDEGGLLLTREGVPLTALGQYATIARITYDESCPADRVLYAAALSENAALSQPEADTPADQVEQWPQDDGSLPEDADMGQVSDTEWEDGSLEGGTSFYPEENGASDAPEIQQIPSTENDLGFFEDGSGACLALMNAKGEVLTDYLYLSFVHDVANAVVFAYDMDGYVTALDETGRVLLAGGYTSLASDGNGGYFGVMPEGTDEYGNLQAASRLLHISQGNVTDTGLWTGTYEPLVGFSQGLMCVYVCSYDQQTGQAGNGGYHYIDSTGTDAFGKEFSYASNFQGAFAEVEDAEGQAYLIDKTGNYLTTDEYSYFDLGAENDGMPIVANRGEGGFDLISKDSLQPIAQFALQPGQTSLYAYLSGDGLVVATSDTGVTLLSAQGETLYSASDESSAHAWYSYSDGTPGRIILSQGEGYQALSCLADYTGAEKSAWYQDISALSWTGDQGRYLVVAYELADTQYDGETVQEPVADSYRYGVIDQDGNVILETNYDYFNYLDSGRYWVGQGNTLMLMDENGNELYCLEN